jgi:hypothetical protein
METKSMFLILIACAVVSVAFTQDQTAATGSAADANSLALQKDVASLLKMNCAVAGCHRGMNPKKKLNLEEDKFIASIVDVPSLENSKLKLVDSKNPEKSYLAMKIRGDKGIVAERMPVDAPALNKDQIDLVGKWIASLSAPSSDQKKNPPQINDADPQQPPVFWASRLVNLPTTKAIGRHDLLFRVSHRFYPTVRSGYDTYFGLNGPAYILVSLGYGITDNIDLTVGHSNLTHEFELTLHWLVAEQENFPCSVALTAGGNWITLKQEGKKTLRSENMKFNIGGIMARQVTDDLSLEVVPAYSSNTDPLQPNSKGTLAVGVGGRYIVYNNTAIIGEWVPVVDGYKANSNSCGIGLEYKAGGHVFQVVLSNCFGLTADQYLPGGDLKIKNSDYRIGFNIFRAL